jgi:hypothetical protein
VHSLLAGTEAQPIVVRAYPGERAIVAVNLAGIVERGASYEVRDAQNFFGAPVKKGTYQGGPMELPMTGLSATQPNGGVSRPHVHTAPEFAASPVTYGAFEGEVNLGNVGWRLCKITEKPLSPFRLLHCSDSQLSIAALLLRDRARPA